MRRLRGALPDGRTGQPQSVKLGAPDRTVTTICPYCAVGCQMDLNIKDDVPGGRMISVSSNAKAPVNGDHLCVKGRYGYDFIQSPARHRDPRVRQYLLDGRPRQRQRGPWVDVDWDTALNIAAKGLLAARDQYGPDSIGLLASGKALNEENYLLNKLARQVLGTNNIDCGARLGRCSTVDGLGEALGLHAMSNSMDDIARHARSLLIIGSDITENDPVFGSRIRQAVLRRSAKVIVASPLFFNIEEYAALSLRHKRGSEYALLNGLMHIILENGGADPSFIEEQPGLYKALKITVEDYPVEKVARLTNLPAEKLHQAAEILMTDQPTSVIWGPELASAQSVRALANLQTLLGNMGVPGGGVAPLRSQNNSQGTSDMGVHPSFFPGYQPVSDEKSRIKFEGAWGTELPLKAGLEASEMLHEAAAEKLKALFLLGSSWSESAEPALRSGLEQCNFVVLCEALPSEMSRYADVLLPGVTFAETTGSYTNTERRIQKVRQAIKTQGNSKPEWRILVELAHRMCPPARRRLVDGICPGWDYADTAAIMDEIASLTPIYAGVSHQCLERGDCSIWPAETAETAAPAVLFEQGVKGNLAGSGI